MKTNLTFDPEFEQLYKSWCNDETMSSLLDLSGVGVGQVDIGAMSHKYFKESWHEEGLIDQNANSNNIGPINYGLEIAKPTMKLLGLYLLHRYLRKDHPLEVANELLTDVITGEYYVHDSSGIGIQIPYCYAWSTMWVAENGIPYGQLPSQPPKHARSFVGQVAEVTMDLSQEFAGAVAPADMLIVYSYFAKKEELTDKEIENDLQSFVHIMNKQFRPGGQSPFTNLSILDRENMESLFGDAIFPDGSKLDLDFAMHVQDVFLEWFSQGNPTTGEPYRFPVTTMNITKDENGKVIDLDFLFKLAYYNTKLGAFNIHSGERAKLAMCCRFINDPETMANFKTDTFGNGGLNIGSHRIVAMNMPRYAYQASSVEEFLVILGERMERAAKILHTHRTRILQKRIEQGFLRAFTVGIASLESMFSTIGTIGFPEAIEALGVPLIAPDGYTLNPEAKELQVEILKFMDKKRTDLSKRYGVPFNIEEVPGESAAINLRNKDAILFDGNVHPRSLYSNQFIPVTVPVSKKDRIEATGEYMRYMTGGSILHLNVDEAIKDPMVMYEVMKYMIESGVDHFAINYGFSRCVKGHSCTGIHNLCPECLSMIEDYLTRIVGYFVPVSTWNRERRVNDFGKRVQY
jgi:ribonucleoside-triphosphate reductase